VEFGKKGIKVVQEHFQQGGKHIVTRSKVLRREVYEKFGHGYFALIFLSFYHYWE
jgi:hypothetical protein